MAFNQRHPPQYPVAQQPPAPWSAENGSRSATPSTSHTPAPQHPPRTNGNGRGPGHGNGHVHPFSGMGSGSHGPSQVTGGPNQPKSSLLTQALQQNPSQTLPQTTVPPFNPGMMPVPNPNNHLHRTHGLKDTSHVPCKFWLKGECQAGRGCPFAHDLKQEQKACAYFRKGNCKYGNKCALLHVTKDGRVLNRPPRMDGNQAAQWTQIQPGPKAGPTMSGAMAVAALHASAASPMIGTPALGPAVGMTPFPPTHGFRPFDERAQGTFALDDRPHTSHHEYSSIQPYQQHYPYHAQMPYQPVHTPNPEISVEQPSPPSTGNHVPTSKPFEAQAGLKIMDVPLPNSLKSNKFEWNAVDDQVARSAPGRSGFMIGSPMGNANPNSPKLKANAARDIWPAQQNKGFVSDSSNFFEAFSPKTGASNGLFARRQISSQRAFSFAQAAGSVPRFGKVGNFDAVDDDSNAEEDLVPGSLQDLLTTEEKGRRFSAKDDEPSGTNLRISSFNKNNNGSLGVNYPLSAGANRPVSPNFGFGVSGRPLSPGLGSVGGSIRSASPNFGPVGSPLRNSSSIWGDSRAVSGPATKTGASTIARPMAEPARPTMSGIQIQMRQMKLNNKPTPLDERISIDGAIDPRSKSRPAFGKDGRTLQKLMNGEQREDSPQRTTSLLSEGETGVFSMDV